MPETRRWQELTTADFAALDMAAVVAVQPVAAVEQHGPHLPVGVDAMINAGIVEQAFARLPADVPAFLLPALPVGKSNEHIRFPGTLTVGYETLCRLWFDIGESVNRTGCRRIVFFNSHGGQPQLVDIVCRELRVRLDMFAVACTWFDTVDLADLFDAEERTHGIHAGAIETSAMLHLHPDLVRMEMTADFVPLSLAVERENAVLRGEGGVGFGWQMQDLHPSGATGDAGMATAARGREIVDRAASALATLLAETARYPLSRLATETEFSKTHASGEHH